MHLPCCPAALLRDSRKCCHQDLTCKLSLQELQQKVPQLLHNFDDIQPTLLLFLQKLQCIAITDQTDNGKNAVMLRRQLSDGVVELRHGPEAQQTQKWLVVTQTVHPGTVGLCLRTCHCSSRLPLHLPTQPLTSARMHSSGT